VSYIDRYVINIKHVSGIHTLVENSNMFAQGLFFRKVAYARCDVVLFVEQIDFTVRTKTKLKLNSVALVRKRTIPTE
jgi:hypothetical protein